MISYIMNKANPSPHYKKSEILLNTMLMYLVIYPTILFTLFYHDIIKQYPQFAVSMFKNEETYQSIYQANTYLFIILLGIICVLQLTTSIMISRSDKNQNTNERNQQIMILKQSKMQSIYFNFMLFSNTAVFTTWGWFSQSSFLLTLGCMVFIYQIYILIRITRIK